MYIGVTTNLTTHATMYLRPHALVLYANSSVLALFSHFLNITQVDPNFGSTSGILSLWQVKALSLHIQILSERAQPDNFG